MVFSIDLDRGVWMRTHPTLNMDVYMYCDDPGVYYDAHGNTVPEELAAAAGFDTEKLGRDHKIKVALKEAQDAVLAGFGEAKTKVSAERGGFKIMDIGLGRFNVHDPEGNLLHKTPISKEQATILLDHLSPKAEPPKPAVKK
jgi:hypothetical protein